MRLGLVLVAFASWRTTRSPAGQHRLHSSCQSRTNSVNGSRPARDWTRVCKVLDSECKVIMYQRVRVAADLGRKEKHIDKGQAASSSSPPRQSAQSSQLRANLHPAQ